MATEKDLINAVRDSLKANGELGRIKAEMRSEVIKLLDNSSRDKVTTAPLPSHDVILINELIREYIDWIGYKYTSTVFISDTILDSRYENKIPQNSSLKFLECDLPKQPLDRTLLVQGLGFKESDRRDSMPLLCSLIETFKNLKGV